MNEVKRIHLGRQPYTISVEAQKELRSYIGAIEKQVEDKDVVEEVEIRMAELLTERGIKGEKVILPKDVHFLKKQLGSPQAFKGDKEEADDSHPNTEDQPVKRLFRDTQNGELAGVSSGLASYFGIDVWIIRIIFIIGVFTGGWGILLYVVLWLVVPEAKTSSDRLQMVGKPVTVDALKEVVDRADIKGAAHRANRTLAGPINTVFDIALKTIGIIFIASGLLALFSLITAGIYAALHSGNLFEQNLFPVGVAEHILLVLGLGVIGIVSLFVVIFGLAMFKRQWPIGAWVTGLLVGLLFLGLAASSALLTDAIPKVRNRYNANLHTTVRTVQPFTSVNFRGDGVAIRYISSDKYSVSLKYYDSPNISSIKTSVSNGTLLIDSSNFEWMRKCDSFCLPPSYDVVATIQAPNADQLRLQAQPMLYPKVPVPINTD